MTVGRASHEGLFVVAQFIPLLSRQRRDKGGDWAIFGLMNQTTTTIGSGRACSTLPKPNKKFAKRTNMYYIFSNGSG